MLKLNVGFSRKLGEANFGSRGASLHLELELVSGLIQQPDKLQDRIRRLYAMARQAVEEDEWQWSARVHDASSYRRPASGRAGNSRPPAAGSSNIPAGAVRRTRCKPYITGQTAMLLS